MDRFAIVVSFTLKPGARDAFLRLVRQNATTSVREEPGCIRFDVMITPDGEQVLLYEIYEDQAAFDRHLETPHFRSFDTATHDLVATKTVGRYRVSENAKPTPGGR